jgi:hypothetical protein
LIIAVPPFPFRVERIRTTVMIVAIISRFRPPRTGHLASGAHSRQASRPVPVIPCLYLYHAFLGVSIGGDLGIEDNASRNQGLVPGHQRQPCPQSNLLPRANNVSNVRTPREFK